MDFFVSTLTALYSSHFKTARVTDFILSLFLGTFFEELLSNLVFKPLNQAAAWLSDSTSIPSLNATPLITLAK